MRWSASSGLAAMMLAPAVWVVATPAPAGARESCGPIRLTAADASPNDIFGRSVALDGDTLIVGAQNAGAAYIFRRTASGWVQEARLPSDGSSLGGSFGFSVAIDGDTAIVGAISDDVDGGARRGSAYVFTRSGDEWTQQARLTAFDGRQHDEFGYAVAIDGDTALIGALLDDGPAAEGQGSAYVFTRSADEWTLQTKLAASDDAAFGGYFGRSVALEGDTALIGARRNEGPATSNHGLAYVFTRTGTVWTEQARLYAGDAAPDDEFGRSVALDGDTALIGSPFDDGPAGVNYGAAYVFSRSGTTWTQDAKLIDPDGARINVLGFRVAIDGDRALLSAVSGDGVVTPRQRSVRIFTRSGGSWTQRSTLLAPDPDAAFVFGLSVALGGDTALVAAYGYDGAAGDSQGAVYVYRLDPADLNADGAIDGVDLGILLGAWGQPGATDFNADGTTDGADFSVLLDAWGPCP